MRSRLLDGASRLFKERGLAGTSISDIAAAADAFPSQITYYFRTKEALFVEAACRDMLYRGARGRAGRAAGRIRRGIHTRTGRDGDGDGFGRLLRRSADADRRRQDLAPLVERTIERLHGEGMRAYAEPDRAAWLALAPRDPDASSRRFWAVAIGVMVEGHAMGRSAEELCTEMLRVLGDQATTTDWGRQRPAASRSTMLPIEYTDGERSS